MTDPTRTTGVYKSVDESGKSKTVVQIASDIKVVAGTVGLLASMIVGGAIWFNGYIQAKATEGFAKQINSEDSAIRAAFETMIDKRAEEIEKNLTEEIVRNRDLEAAKLDDLKRTVWKATNPSRRSDDPEPAWEDDP